MKILIFIAVYFMTLSSFASSRTTAIVSSDIRFSGGNLSDYLLPEKIDTDILKNAKEKCQEEFGSKFKAIQNLQVQLHGGFKISITNKLEATTNQIVVYTAVVECD